EPSVRKARGSQGTVRFAAGWSQCSTSKPTPEYAGACTAVQVKEWVNAKIYFSGHKFADAQPVWWLGLLKSANTKIENPDFRRQINDLADYVVFGRAEAFCRLRLQVTLPIG